MSDQFYAVEFRSMHTAVHHIAVFSLEEVAQDFFELLDEHENIPEEYQFDEANFVGFESINFRNKPYEAFDMEILYINEWEINKGNIPDVWNY